MTGTSEEAPHQTREGQEDWTWCPEGMDSVKNGYPTREAAIEAAREWVTLHSGAPSYRIYIGQAVTAYVNDVIPDGSDIVQHMTDHSEGNVESGMWLADEFGWLDKVPDDHLKLLGDAVRPVIRNWLEKYGYMPTWWHVPESDVIEVEATPPEIETMPAAGSA